MILTMLTKRAADFHILLDDVSITHLAFSKDYTAAVEAKQVCDCVVCLHIILIQCLMVLLWYDHQVAQQDAGRAKYIVDRALQEKRSIIIKAEGEARAAELVGKAIQKNPAFIQLRRIEAAKDVATTVAGSQNKVYLNSDNLLLNHLGEAPSLSTGGSDKKGGW